MYKENNKKIIIITGNWSENNKFKKIYTRTEKLN
jgi:hypothetical protein